MTTELFTLVALAILALVMPAFYGSLRVKQVGSGPLLGNREGLPPPTGAAGRGLRAHQNLIENLVPYAIVILTAHVIGANNGVTAGAAIVFLIARLVHAGSYFAGITIIRTVAYAVGLIAIIAIMTQLF
ncbi:MAG TPA: MAPEG family protein [Geminicoccus sp.]|uniref:MAPEG family protein n=1 Tax=Geminicoccus sp. TaxID=2024832 RepID=UPI002E30B286|nr:MAPEG family protein [Geminicoccus sp.]HEX2529743.1 MAPEG family protein [Geminicoccus sp.]